MSLESDIEQLEKIQHRIAKADFGEEYKSAGIHLNRAYKAVTEAIESLEALIRIRDRQPTRAKRHQ